jgi:hypothetical protein
MSDPKKSGNDVGINSRLQIDKRWTSTRLDIESTLRSAGANEDMIRVICERMRLHYAQASLGELVEIPHMVGLTPISAQSVEEAFRTVLVHYDRKCSLLLNELLTLQVCLMQQTSTGDRSPTKH